MFARSSDFTTSKFLSNKGMFSYDTGKLYDYTQGSDSWFNQTNKFPTDDGIVLPIFGKRPSLRLRSKNKSNMVVVVQSIIQTLVVLNNTDQIEKVQRWVVNWRLRNIKNGV